MQSRSAAAGDKDVIGHLDPSWIERLSRKFFLFVIPETSETISPFFDEIFLINELTGFFYKLQATSESYHWYESKTLLELQVIVYNPFLLSVHFLISKSNFKLLQKYSFGSSSLRSIESSMVSERFEIIEPSFTKDISDRRKFVCFKISAKLK